MNSPHEGHENLSFDRFRLFTLYNPGKQAIPGEPTRAPKKECWEDYATVISSLFSSHKLVLYFKRQT